MIARSLYIDHDFNFENERQLTPYPEHVGEKPERTRTGKIANQSPIGYALVTQPFFALAHIFTETSTSLMGITLNDDGYRGVFGIMVPLSALFYAFVGMYLAYKIAAEFFGKVLASVSVNCVVLSTSLLWYVTGHLTMVHAHSFALVAALIYITMPFYQKELSGIGIPRFIGIGIIFAFAVMIRPQNAVYAIVPTVPILLHLTKSVVGEDDIKKDLLKLLGKICLSVVFFLICFSPQTIYWKIVYGSYLTNSYGGTGWSFHFLNPDLIKTLFSTNHGLFLWHPITLFSCFGVCLLFLRLRTHRIFLMTLSICFLLTWYIIASWDYTMANSFGNRGFDASTVLFILGWGEILWRLSKHKIVPVLLCAILIFWNFQLLLQQRYLGWLPFNGEIPYTQVFKNYLKLPQELQRIRAKYFT
jgi:hypothetical protein